MESTVRYGQNLNDYQTNHSHHLSCSSTNYNDTTVTRIYTMTTHLSDISELRDALNILHPLILAYYKIKQVTDKLENETLNTHDRNNPKEN